MSGSQVTQDTIDGNRTYSYLSVKKVDIFCSFPNQAEFAIVEEFVERILRAEGIREEWEIFVQDFATVIWQDKFQSINANSQIKQEWISAIEETKQSNKLENIKFT